MDVQIEIYWCFKNQTSNKMFMRSGAGRQQICPHLLPMREKKERKIVDLEQSILKKRTVEEQQLN